MAILKNLRWIMVSWWIENVLDLNFVGSLIHLSFFRILFSFALLYKFSHETYRGYFQHLEPRSYLSIRFEFLHKYLFKVLGAFYQPLYILKFLAAGLLLFGFYQKISLIILVVCIFTECMVYPKFHANYFLLISISLLFSSSTVPILDFFEAYVNHEVISLDGNLLGQYMIMVTTLFMYFTTAVRKVNKDFLSGKIILNYFKFTKYYENERKFMDHWVPRSVVRSLLKEQRVVLRILSLFMCLTIFLELIIPLFFLTSYYELWPVFLCAGFLMHLLFTMILPSALLHFSIVTLGAYILFLPMN